MSFTGISKIGLEAWCLLASVAAHAAFVAVVLALPALAQPEVADEERVSVDVITPEELQEIIEEARLQPPQPPQPEPEPELDSSVLEPPPEPKVNTEEKPEDETEAAPADAAQPEPDQAAKPPPQPEDTTEQKDEQSAAEKPLPLTPRESPGGPASIGPKSDAELQQGVRTPPTIPAPGRPIVIPRKRVVPQEETVLVGDRKREALCHEAAKSEIAKARPDLKPDLVFSSAIIPSEALENIMVANGAAFKSEGRWYNLKFKCIADPFQEKLISFDFLIGPAFPEDEVVELKVTVED